jgi:hypothetical protein
MLEVNIDDVTLCFFENEIISIERENCTEFATSYNTYWGCATEKYFL